DVERSQFGNGILRVIGFGGRFERAGDTRVEPGNAGIETVGGGALVFGAQSQVESETIAQFPIVLRVKGVELGVERGVHVDLGRSEAGQAEQQRSRGVSRERRGLRRIRTLRESAVEGEVTPGTVATDICVVESGVDAVELLYGVAEAVLEGVAAVIGMDVHDRVELIDEGSVGRLGAERLRVGELGSGKDGGLHGFGKTGGEAE